MTTMMTTSDNSNNDIQDENKGQQCAVINNATIFQIRTTIMTTNWRQ